MPIITLITDFGTKDFYAGALKGQILSEIPAIQLVDISHRVEAFNINEAAFCLKNAYAHFPENTVHLVLVNDDFSNDLRCLAVKHKGHYFLGFDNGMFNLAFEGEPELAVELSISGEADMYRPAVFQQLLIATAKELLGGRPISQLGRQVHHIKQRTGIQPVTQESVLRGTVIYIDEFENAITNITKTLFEDNQKGRQFDLLFKRNERLSEISRDYNAVPEGEKLCSFNSSGYLEIAINKGRASSLLGLRLGDTIQIDFV